VRTPGSKNSISNVCADERQVVVSLTDAGRRLREQGLGMSLVEATGLAPDEFSRMLIGTIALRNNLIEAAREKK
jgi:DNA-binding MarR family transcriptional regulator